MHLASQLEVTAAQATEAGLKAQNEDCIGLRIPDQHLLTMKGITAVIADGVSAAEAGKEASETCVRNFISDYYTTPDAWSVKTAGQKILDALNRWLYSQSHSQGHKRGYVSTFSTLILKSQQGYLFHVGDTRIYRLRDGELICLTRDHSTSIDEQTTYLARAMGMDNRLEVDFKNFDLEEGDIFLLSTDGVHDFLPEKILQGMVRSLVGKAQHEFDHVSHQLIEQALKNGSNDNLSCQIIRVDKLPDANNQEVYKRLSQLKFPPPLEIGQSLDGMKVLKELHASQRSQIYLVENESDKTRYIMKTPSLNYEDDPAYIERFVLEQWIGRRVDSPYVVKVVNPDRPKTALYTLMEYVEGQTLTQWIKENPKPDINEVIRIVELVSRGLRVLHRRDVLHQDIKPDNIILNREGIPKIIDFGACYAAGVEEIDTPFEREAALGTADYSAPETRFRSNKTKKSDLFSLAVVTYEMLTGKHPYGEDLAKLKDQRQLSRLNYQSAQIHNPMVPVWMDGALEKALAPYSGHRHQALSEFIYDLQTPNHKYRKKNFQPLIERNPLRFWQVVAAIEAVAIILILKFS